MKQVNLPLEIARLDRLKGSEALRKRAECLIEKYPRMKRKLSVDAMISAHLLLAAALNERVRKQYTIEGLEKLSWDVHTDNQLRINEKRRIAERGSAAIQKAGRF